jgi:hypothetical protein
MPLEKGSSQKVISRNIEEMQEHGHSHAQSVAAALHTAKDDGFGGLKREANELPQSDAAYAPATAMTIEDIQREGEKLWAGPDGNIGSKVGAASGLPQSTQSPTPVYPAGDSTEEERTARKEANPSKKPQSMHPETRSRMAANIFQTRHDPNPRPKPMKSADEVSPPRATRRTRGATT